MVVPKRYIGNTETVSGLCDTGLSVEVTYLQTLLIFLLLLVDYAQAKIYLICLFKIGLHAHDLGEGLFRMFE